MTSRARRAPVAVALGLLAALAAAGLACRDHPPGEGTDWPSAPEGTGPEGAEPAILGLGTISTGAPEFAFTLSADGSEAYFNRASEDRSHLEILGTRRSGRRWEEPRTVSFSGTYRDVDPFLSPDGSRLFFSSNRPKEEGAEPADFDLWVVERSSGGWGEPQNLGLPVNTEATEIYSTVAANGNLYFASDREGGDFLYLARFENGAYRDPERLVMGTEAESEGGNPAISPDETLLVFVSTREGGPGGADLWLSRFRAGGWTSPVLLPAPISSPYADFAPAISPDGTLTFTSERPGIAPAVAEGRPPGDLYRVRLDAVLSRLGS